MKNNNVNVTKSFEIEMMDTGRWKNLTAGAFFFFYTLYSSGIINLMNKKEVVMFLFSVIIPAIIGQFLIAPYTNRMLTKDISDRLERNAKNLLNNDERTLLLKDILRCPRSICLEVIFVVLGASLIPLTLLLIRFHITPRTFLFVLACCIGGLNITGTTAYCYSESLCCKKAVKIVNQGINTTIIHKDKFYGSSTKTRIFYFTILPILIAAILQTSHFHMILFDGWNNRFAIVHSLFVFAANIFAIFYVSLYIHKILTLNSKNITNVLEKLTDHKKSVYLPTDLGNELSYNIYLIDELITYLRDISMETASTGEAIAVASHQLSEDANITAETSISEAAAIRECLATMENAKSQHKRISSHIDLIQQSASSTKKSADTSSDLLTAGIHKMSEITQSNLDTIYGIKELSEKIESIWAIVESIDAVAERTKTIAFNAELEASLVGEQGEKFYIVANEILRLSATIKNSISEIKRRITDILHSCDNLIISSESGTQKTREGSEFYTKLEANFKELCLSSDITAESLRKIVDITDVQQGAFEQINSILSKINVGFESFSQNSQKISLETKALKETATNLGFYSQEAKGVNK